MSLGAARRLMRPRWREMRKGGRSGNDAVVVVWEDVGITITIEYDLGKRLETSPVASTDQPSFCLNHD